MKNHIKVNGKLLQTNKTWSHLKNGQKEWISNQFSYLYHQKMIMRRTVGKLPRAARDEVISDLYEKIKEREIWIPYGEVKKFACSRTRKVVNRFSKKHAELTRQFEEEHLQKKTKH